MSELPLSDIRVLDLSRLLPGGFCSLLLADLGADVIKVEDTGTGDYVRWAPPLYGDEHHHPFGLTLAAARVALARRPSIIPAPPNTLAPLEQPPHGR